VNDAVIDEIAVEENSQDLLSALKVSA